MALLLQVSFTWRPDVGDYRLKMDYLEAHADEFSVVFVGSSRIYRHVDPDVVDEAARAEGVEVRSFNLGIDALNLIEMRTLLDRLARLGSPRLRYVLIEPAFTTNLPLRNLATERAVYFHDLANTRLAIASNLRSPRARATIGRNALACLYHYVNLGKLASALLPPATRSQDPEAVLPPLDTSRGFSAQDDNPPAGARQWHERFLKNRDGFARLMRSEERLVAHVEDGEFDLQNAAIVAMARRLEKAGITPVFLITPGFHQIDFYLQFEASSRREAPEIPMLSYLEDHEEFYDPDLWYDTGHLNGEGAARFSRRLGEDLAALIQGRSGG